MLMKAILVLCLLPLIWCQTAQFESFAGRPVNANCPPLEPRTQGLAQNARQCQFIISLDSQGCRQIAQDCARASQCSNPNEVFWQCSLECEPSCSNQSPNCRNVCGQPKCQCAPGFVRNSQNTCVARNQCPVQNDPTPTCQFGEVLVRQNCSALTCEKTCSGQMSCNQRCNQLMCLCPQGMFRDSRSGQCVPQNQCPSTSPPQQGCSRDDQCQGDSTVCSGGRCIQGCTAHSQCANGMQCRSGRCTIPTCETDSHCLSGTICLGNRCAEGCRSSSQCPNGLSCVQNQCRQSGGQNPPQCRSDRDCGNGAICHNSMCRRGCRNHNDCSNGFGCSNGQCVRMCFRDSECDRGFDCQNGRCVRGGMSNPQCKQGETFMSCGSACEPSCNMPRNTVCTQQCVPKCQCQQGLLRNRSGQCVPRQFC